MSFWQTLVLAHHTLQVSGCPLMNSLGCMPCFWVVSKGLFTKLVTSKVWVQTRVNITTYSGKKGRGEGMVSMGILVTDGVGEGKLGMMTVFCHSDRVKVEPSFMLLTLVRQDSHEPFMVVMKIFSTSPYFQWRSFSLPFLNIATLSEGTPTIQFPLSWLHLCQLLLYLPNQVILPKEKKEANELKITLITKEALWESSIKGHHLSSLVPLLLPPSVPTTSLSTYKDRGLQTDKTWL